ncbi:MAG TPA: hypothetical protein VFC58_08460 [Desulfosporosinus sp.]|nr:hypothetical protein [Desulfosporosinus sp.]
MRLNNMRLNNMRLGMLFLGMWLIMTGLSQVISLPIPAIGTILALLSIVAGALLLLDR